MPVDTSRLVGPGTVLVDSSVWIRHLREEDAGVTRLMDNDLLVVHPAVVGELACGNLPTRAATLRLLTTLIRVPPAADAVVLRLIEAHGLSGRGVGWIDCHLLAACRLRGPSLWTRDRRLREVAAEVLGEERVWG